MKNKLARLLTAVVLLGPGAAQAASIAVAITVDNSYALYTGTNTTPLAYVGTDNNWGTTETYSFNLPNTHYIYVVTQSDLSTAQGFLAQFTNLDNNTKFYSNDLAWQVTATGRYGHAPYSASAADFAELGGQLAVANAGTNPSGGWVAPTAGGNNGAGPWGLRPGIDAAAKWVWYSSNGSTDPTIGGFNHLEYLIFRISVAAGLEPTPPSTVPEPGTFAMLAMGLVGLGLSRRKKRA